MANPVCEGDVISFTWGRKGFLYAQTPSSNSVTITDDSHYHHCSFQVFTEKFDTKISPLEVQVQPWWKTKKIQGQAHTTDTKSTSLVYGRKLKFLHVASNMYLAYSKNKKCSDVKLHLVKEFNKETCLFRILPSQNQTNKQRGMTVLYHDEVKLESVHFMGYSMLCCDLQNSRYMYEVKLAVRESIFEISSPLNNRDQLPNNAIRSFDVVMLFNDQFKSYLAGFVNQEPEKITSVKARKRESVHGILKDPPLSGDCFYVLETKATDTCDKEHVGEQLMSGVTCYIKHLPTEQYLSVIEGKVILKELDTDNFEEESGFVLESVDTQFKDQGLTKGSFVVIKKLVKDDKAADKKTDMILVPTKASTQQFPDSKSVSMTKWFEVSLEERKQPVKQCFCIEKIDSDVIHDYYYISGVTATLKKHFQNLSFETPSHSDDDETVDSCIEVLNELLRWLKDIGTKQSVRASMLQVTQCLDVLLMDFLCKTIPSTKILTEKVSTVLQFFVDFTSKDNHFYLAHEKFLDTLINQIGESIGIEDVLCCLVKDERLITTKVAEKLIRRTGFIQSILQKQDASVFNLLSTLCFTAEKPIRYLQNSIRDIIFSQEVQQYLIRTEVKDGVIHFESPIQIAGPISQICSKVTALNHSNRKMFDFYIAQLKLFSQICKGVNLDSINEICKIITFREALICIKDDTLRPLLKSAYLDFVVSAYVDYNVEESGIDIDRIWHAFYWDNISDDSKKTTALRNIFEGIPNKEEMKELKKSIQHHLDINMNRASYEEEVEGQNELLCQILAVVEPLVGYGFYREDPDIAETLISVLVLPVKANGEVKANVEDGNQYVKNENNQKVFSIKTRVVRILHLLFKQLLYAALGEFMHTFKVVQAEDPGVANSLVPLCSSDCQHEQFYALTHEELIKFFQKQGYGIFIKNDVNINGILLDLLKCDDDDLRLSSILLLFDILQKENILFHDSNVSYITMQESEVFNYMKEHGAFHDPSKVLLRLLQGQAKKSDSQLQLSNELFEYVKRACMIDDDETQPHVCNQKIAFTTGIVSSLLTYIRLFCSSNYPDQDELLESSCNCLQVIAHRNNLVQQKIFINFDDFIESSQPLMPVARLMTETLCENYELCHCLSESCINQLYTIAATASQDLTSATNCTEYYTVLETVVKPHKSSKGVLLLLKNHQELIARKIAEHAEEHSGKVQKEALQNAEDAGLLQLLAVSDLLATTAEGNCVCASEICQKFFTLDELVNIIANSEIEFDRKKPFARILKEGFINTEMNFHSLLSKNSSFWTHMKECASLLELLDNKLSESQNLKRKAKIEVRVLFSQYSSFSAWKKRKFYDEKMQHGDKSISVSSVLCYLIDGLIPLVTSLCSHFVSSSTKSFDQVEVIKLLSASAMKLLQNHPEVFCTMTEMTHYWDKFTNAVKTILPQDGIQFDQMMALCKDQFYISTEVRQVEQELKEEIEKNESFQKFVANFKISYQSRDECDKISFLPTDPCFKKLVEIFSDDLGELFSEKNNGYKKKDQKKDGNENESHEKDGHEKERNENFKVNRLLELMSVFHRQLKQPLTAARRTDIDTALHTSLQILCGVLNSAICSVDPQLEPNSFNEECDKKIKPLQDALLVLNSHEKVIIHLSHSKNDVVIQVFVFLREILFNSNKNSQHAIADIMTKSRDAKFFQRLNEVLVNAAVFLDHLTSWQFNDSAKKINDSPETEQVTEMVSLATLQPGTETAFYRSGIEEPGRGLEETGRIEETGSGEVDDTSEKVENINEASVVIRRANVVLDVVSRVCDGQIQEVQNMLREPHLQNIKIVGAITRLFQTLVQNFNEESISSIKKAIRALIELCVGNFANQEVAVNGQVVDSINVVLRCTKESHPKVEILEMMGVKASAIELLEVLIEESNENSNTLAQEIARDLSVEDITLTMEEIWLSGHCMDKIKSERGLFKAHHVLKKLSDSTGEDFESYAKYKDQRMSDHLNQFSQSIEVKYGTPNGEDILAKVYFRFDPKEQLEDDVKDVIKKNIKRDSPEDKVKDLLQWMKAIRKNNHYQAKLKANFFSHKVIFATYLRRFILAILTLILNFFVIFFSDVPASTRNANHTITNESDNSTITNESDATSYVWFTGYLLYILGSLHIILSLWMVIDYYVREWENILFNFLKEPFWRTTFNKWSKVIWGSKVLPINEKPVKRECFEVYFLSFSPIYRIIFLLCSIFALATSGYLYCGCILYVFLENDVLQQVLVAIKRSAKQLIILGLLGLSVLLMFSVISFVSLQNFFDNETIFCRSLIECYVSVIREGLLGTIGTILPVQFPDQSEPSFHTYWTRSLFDLAIFIVITVLGLNIVIAIIVDRFSEFRTNTEKINKDKQNLCFVCGFERDTFERKGQVRQIPNTIVMRGFDHHTKNDHHMWNYVHFLLYLDSMDSNDYNAMEKYVHDKVDNDEIDFFPLHKAKVLEGKVNEPNH